MMTESNDSSVVRLALWASMMMPIKDAGMSWIGFSYTDAEWAQMAKLAEAVHPDVTLRFKVVTAAICISLPALLIGGVFVPLLSALYPNPANTSALVFALLLAATALLA